MSKATFFKFRGFNNGVILCHLGRLMKAGWESLVKEAAKIIYKFHAKIKNADQVGYYFCSINS